MTTWNRVTVLLIFVGVLRSVYNDSPWSYLGGMLALGLAWIFGLTQEPQQGRKDLSVAAQRWSRSRDRLR